MNLKSYKFFWELVEILLIGTLLLLGITFLSLYKTFQDLPHRTNYDFGYAPMKILGLNFCSIIFAMLTSLGFLAWVEKEDPYYIYMLIFNDLICGVFMLLKWTIWIKVINAKNIICSAKINNLICFSREILRDTDWIIFLVDF
uniref:Uncharacterized protein n=1 Tax=Megaselia scalaris TaxID=36166 RepID=T1GWM3_MEGSC